MDLPLGPFYIIIDVCLSSASGKTTRENHPEIAQ